MCLDEGDLSIYGDFTSAYASQLNIDLVKCKGQAHCKSEEEVEAFFKGKYIILLYNHIRFDSEYFGRESIKQESKMFWIRASSYKQTQPFSVIKTELELQDEYLDLDEITRLEDASIFSLKALPARPYNFDDDISQNISIEMNLDLIRISRSVYSGLDLLAEIGGFQAAVGTIITAFLALLPGQSIDDYLI